LTWIGGIVVTARDLIRQELLPLAREGLQAAGIVAADIDRYLGVVAERVESGLTGSQWLLNSLASMQGSDTKDAIAGALVAGTVARQWEGRPVHEWTPAKLEEGRTGRSRDLRIEEFMTTDLFTVRPQEPIDLVVNLMDWKHIRHVPVEDERGRLVGVVSWFEVVHHLARGDAQGRTEAVAVSTVMKENPVVVPPETPVLDAIALMRRERLAHLLVVKDSSLVGIVTERDILNITALLLERHPLP
jgi:CBS domain-containing protein